MEICLEQGKYVLNIEDLFYSRIFVLIYFWFVNCCFPFNLAMISFIMHRPPM